MIKQVKDLKPGDNLYILKRNDLSISKITEIRKIYSDKFYKINRGFDDMQVVGGDCTTFSYGEDMLIFLNKKDAISWLEGIMDKIKEMIEYVKEEE